MSDNQREANDTGSHNFRVCTVEAHRLLAARHTPRGAVLEHTRPGEKRALLAPLVPSCHRRNHRVLPAAIPPGTLRGMASDGLKVHNLLKVQSQLARERKRIDPRPPGRGGRGLAGTG